jgi:hypothetical protein
MRKFLPDFEIIIDEKIHIVEAKSYISIKCFLKETDCMSSEPFRV